MIIDLQRRLAEIGRIRIGQQVPSGNGKRPSKLSTFRLTSGDRNRINQAADLYGGKPQEWDAPAGKQWEVITEAEALNVVVPPGDMAFSQFYELWSGGGCQRRCDGNFESISDGPCLCDPDERECKIHTRLSVMLRDLPGLGVWRIDTSGYYAAVELQGAVEVVQLAAGRGQMLPAQLRLEQRMVKRPGSQTKRFAVPVLDIEVSPAQLLSGGSSFDPLEAGTLAIEPPRQPIDGASPLTPVPESVPEAPIASVAEQARAKRQRRRGTQQSIPSTGLAPRTAEQVANGAAVAVTEPPPEPPEPPAENEPEGPPTTAMNRKMHALFRDADLIDRDDRLIVTSYIIGHQVDTSAGLTKSEGKKLIDTLEQWLQAGELNEQIREVLNAATLAAEGKSATTEGN
jgi:hypothetical protein